MLASGAAGWLAARIAPAHPMRHAFTLGVIGLVAGASGAVATWDAGPEFGPKWYAVAVAATALPCVWLGARMRTVHR